jgi:hypothetical protein
MKDLRQHVKIYIWQQTKESKVTGKQERKIKGEVCTQNVD